MAESGKGREPFRVLPTSYWKPAPMPRAISLRYQQRQNEARRRGEKRRQSLLAKDPQLAELEQDLVQARVDLLQALALPESQKHKLEQHLEDCRRARDAYVEGLGYRLRDYEGAWHLCPTCRDTGYVEEQHCPVCYAALAQEELWRQSTLPSSRCADFRQDRQDLFEGEALAEHQWLVTELARWAAHFPHLEPRHLYLFGPTGTGKTWFSEAIARDLLERGFAVLYLTASACFERMQAWRQIQANYRPDPLRWQEAEEAWQQLFEVDCLILDDLGIELCGRQEALADLLQLINERSKLGKAMVISSNLAIEDLSRHYDERVSSRVLGDFALFQVRGFDLRLRQRQEQLGRL